MTGRKKATTEEIKKNFGFDESEQVFKSIIGVKDEDIKEEGKQEVGKGRPKAERETKKRVSLAVYPSVYSDLQKIAYVDRQSVSDIVSELIAQYVNKNAEKLKEYEKIKAE